MRSSLWRVRRILVMVCKLALIVCILCYIIPQLLGLFSQHVGPEDNRRAPHEGIMKVSDKEAESYLSRFVFKFKEVYDADFN